MEWTDLDWQAQEGDEGSWETTRGSQCKVLRRNERPIDVQTVSGKSRMVEVVQNGSVVCPQQERHTDIRDVNGRNPFSNSSRDEANADW